MGETEHSRSYAAIRLSKYYEEASCGITYTLLTALTSPKDISSNVLPLKTVLGIPLKGGLLSGLSNEIWNEGVEDIVLGSSFLQKKNVA